MHPKWQGIGCLYPVNSCAGFKIHEIERTLNPVKRGLDASAVKPPNVASIGKAVPCKGRRDHFCSSGIAVPDTECNVRCISFRYPEMLQSRGKKRDHMVSGKQKSNSGAAYPVEMRGLSCGILCFLKPFITDLKKLNLLGFCFLWFIHFSHRLCISAILSSSADYDLIPLVQDFDTLLKNFQEKINGYFRTVFGRLIRFPFIIIKNYNTARFQENPARHGIHEHIRCTMAPIYINNIKALFF